MKTIYLLRHAKSSWDDSSLEDHDRPLAPRGKKAARLMASYIAREGIAVDVVLCSSAARARSTLELVLPSLRRRPDVRTSHELYLANAGSLLRTLQGIGKDLSAVLVVGHNPAMEDMAELLAGDGEQVATQQLQLKFPTGALATLTTGVEWRELGPGLAYLESLVTPRRLENSD